jgi:hypothetical protein
MMPAAFFVGASAGVLASPLPISRKQNKVPAEGNCRD